MKARERVVAKNKGDNKYDCIQKMTIIKDFMKVII
jgi:hypothetical protein